MNQINQCKLCTNTKYKKLAYCIEHLHTLWINRKQHDGKPEILTKER